jgi:hypothetical protein
MAPATAGSLVKSGVNFSQQSIATSADRASSFSIIRRLFATIFVALSKYLNHLKTQLEETCHGG